MTQTIPTYQLNKSTGQWAIYLNGNYMGVLYPLAIPFVQGNYYFCFFYQLQSEGDCGFAGSFSQAHQVITELLVLFQMNDFI